ncbi:SpoIIE family protein phosphatase [Streptomyces fuscichromogenes]|uniref:SpoIIE family protein phosphatase n=1 Tax=Streptomyces fuscichromogenes TaxID=1324013 RepID=UPI0038272D2F
MSGSPGRLGSLASEDVACALIGADGVALRWSEAGVRLLGWTAEDVCGHPLRDLFVEEGEGERVTTAGMSGGRLRHRSGSAVDVVLRTVPLDGTDELLVLIAPASESADEQQAVTVLRALRSQDVVRIALYDMDLKVTWSHSVPGVYSEDADAVEALLRRVRDTGHPVVGHPRPFRAAGEAPGQWRMLSLSAFRLEDAQGGPAGVASMFVDVSAHQRARRRLDLLHEASLRIGGSLDVARTAQDLADVLVPALGDLAMVTLAEAVPAGEEPPKAFGGGDLHLRRVAVASATGRYPSGLLQPDTPVPILPDMPLLRRIQQGKTLVFSREEGIAHLPGPRLASLFVPDEGHSMAVTPLFARGLVLGIVTVWRTGQPDPFDEDDAHLLEQIASRAALAVDNARRYTREHRAVVALQQRLLPPARTVTPAAETVGVYQPAGGSGEVRGDWFDAIALPSLRIALVVGDVAGRGLAATAAMSRLRTAVQTLADLELSPDDLLAHVDDLVQRLAREAPPGTRDTVGATCLYAVYDPVARQCTMASAGHPAPVLVWPDGTTETVAVHPGPPLGVGGMPFETTTLDIEPDSVLALYTKGLLRLGGLDLDAGLLRLSRELGARCGAGSALESVGRAVVTEGGGPLPADDLTLLLARVRAVPQENMAAWTFPADPAAVADARSAATRQLADWELDDLSFTTELVVSELVTNALRYAGGPVGLRLIRQNVLVCEVTDPSNTQPRLRRARTTDEGGRGLFLVAQMTSRWGSRYGERGKTIWAEQPIQASADRGRDRP